MGRHHVQCYSRTPHNILHSNLSTPVLPLTPYRKPRPLTLRLTWADPFGEALEVQDPPVRVHAEEGGRQARDARHHLLPLFFRVLRQEEHAVRVVLHDDQVEALGHGVELHPRQGETKGGSSHSSESGGASAAESVFGVKLKTWSRDVLELAARDLCLDLACGCESSKDGGLTYLLLPCDGHAAAGRVLPVWRHV